MCPYANYGYIDGYDREVILCSKSNQSCPFTRYCNKVNKIIPNDRVGYTMEDCKLSKEKNIPQGSNRVRFSKVSGGVDYLYIEVDDQVIRVKNTLGDKVKDYVYLRGEEISLEPFKTKTVIKEVKSNQTEKAKESDR